VFSGLLAFFLYRYLILFQDAHGRFLAIEADQAGEHKGSIFQTVDPFLLFRQVATRWNDCFEEFGWGSDSKDYVAPPIGVDFGYRSSDSAMFSQMGGGI
jgi:hypothetical protein